MRMLVIDIGSSSVRALLFDEQARPISGATVSEPHEFTTLPSGAATLDAVQLQARVESCLDRLLQHSQAKDIQVVGMATFAGNVLGLDDTGGPITPVYTYADTRSVEDIALLKTQLDETAVHQRTGCMLHTAYLPGRLHWLRRTEPEMFQRTAAWVDFGTYLYSQWFGSAACSYSIASWSGLLNRDPLDWDGVWLQQLELPPSLLPPLVDYDELQTGLKPAYTQRWPALRDVPFCRAVGDGAAANIGAGCVDESRIALTLGTTAALRVVIEAKKPPVPWGLWSYRVDKNRHLIGGATSEGGNIFRWARDVLALDGIDIEKQLAERTPDAHGLTILPLLAGERSPGWAADAAGAIVGLRLATTPLDILQAALESVALRLALVFDQLAPIVSSDAQIIGGGGALLKSPVWSQMIASALDHPLHIAAETESTARGVALLALRAIGISSSLSHEPEMLYTVEPKQAALFRAARERQTALYNQLIRKK